MMTYLCHDLWISIACSLYLYPAHIENRKAPLPFLIVGMIVFVEIACLLTYLATV